MEFAINMRLQGIIWLLLMLTLNSFAMKAEEKSMQLKVMSLNVWGTPFLIVGTKDKKLRLNTIGEMMKKKEYHVYLLQELFYYKDYIRVKKRAEKAGLYVTGYRELNAMLCTYIFMVACSGLTIVSQFPIQASKYFYFEEQCQGHEKFSGKGFGRITIEPIPYMKVDLYSTHFCSYLEEDNMRVRAIQAKQVLREVDHSISHFSIIGGDFNTDRRTSQEKTYSILTGDLQDSMDVYLSKHNIKWRQPSQTTYANPRNKYSNKDEPELLDYIFFTKNKRVQDLPISTVVPKSIEPTLFEIPPLTTTKRNGDVIPLSDHEAVTTEFKLVITCQQGCPAQSRGVMPKNEKKKWWKKFVNWFG